MNVHDDHQGSIGFDNIDSYYVVIVNIVTELARLERNGEIETHEDYLTSYPETHAYRNEVATDSAA